MITDVESVEVVREPQTDEATIVVYCVGVYTVPLDAGEDRRAYNKRVAQIEKAVRATVQRMEGIA